MGVSSKHQNTITLSVMERWKNGQLKRTIKELSPFGNKKPEELELEFVQFDLDNSNLN